MWHLINSALGLLWGTLALLRVWEGDKDGAESALQLCLLFLIAAKTGDLNYD